MRSATQGEKAALVKELREEKDTALNDLLEAIGLVSDQRITTNSARPMRSKNEMPICRLKLLHIFNENRKNDTA